MRYIGIDLGGTNIAVGITDGEGRILCKCSVKTETERGTDAILSRMADTARRLAKETGTPWEDITSVGIGSPGAVDAQSGMVLSASNLGFRDVRLGERMQNLLQKPVYVENDANCAALAEARLGAARGCRECVMITLGTGIGGGLVIGGKLYGGFNGFGGELGHAVIDKNGEPCVCGKRGCFETYASATALVRQTRRAAEQDRTSLLWACAEEEGKFSGKTAFVASRRGDKTAQGVVERYIDYLATGLVNIIKILQPEVIVIGGGVSHEGAHLFEPLTKQVMHWAYRDYIPADKRASIKAAELGNDAGIVGAALVAKEGDTV